MRIRGRSTKDCLTQGESFRAQMKSHLPNEQRSKIRQKVLGRRAQHVQYMLIKGMGLLATPLIASESITGPPGLSSRLFCNSLDWEQGKP